MKLFVGGKLLMITCYRPQVAAIIWNEEVYHIVVARDEKVSAILCTGLMEI
jgi:hypothetical protein